MPGLKVTPDTEVLAFRGDTCQKTVGVENDFMNVHVDREYEDALLVPTHFFLTPLARFPKGIHLFGCLFRIIAGNDLSKLIHLLNGLHAPE